MVSEILKPENRGKHFTKHSKRELINVVLYLNKTGCQWALLPNDFPPYKTVSSFYHRAKQLGLWERIMSVLVKKIRTKAKHKPEPSYGIIDSQSVKTMYASVERGFDGGKKIKGRKRHTVTDTMGNLLVVKVHAANIHDTIAGGEVFKVALVKYPSIKTCAADAGYRKTFVNILKSIGISVDIIEKIMPKAWSVLPIRWIVERTFGWSSHSRRLSKDFEISTASAENMFMISHIATLLKRF